jgi:hypothetical protein
MTPLPTYIPILPIAGTQEIRASAQGEDIEAVHPREQVNDNIRNLRIVRPYGISLDTNHPH